MKNVFFILVASMLALVVVPACKKTEPCEAIITVVDTLGKPVQGAKVVLRQDSVLNAKNGVRADVFEEEFTASNGEAFFEFKWEAVLNVEVVSQTQQARDYIRLKQSETVRKTVIVK